MIKSAVKQGLSYQMAIADEKALFLVQKSCAAING